MKDGVNMKPNPTNPNMKDSVLEIIDVCFKIVVFNFHRILFIKQLFVLCCNFAIVKAKSDSVLSNDS
jgi:hypothetical protein